MQGDTSGHDLSAAEREVGHAESHGRVRTDWVVYGVAAVLAIGFVVWGVVSTGTLSSAASTALGWLLTNLGWSSVLAATGFVVFSLWLAFSRYGKVPLGKDDEKPEFRTVSWIAMMFSAGMGIGLMFFGMAEPLSHFMDPPPGTSRTGEPPDTTQDKAPREETLN